MGKGIFQSGSVGSCEKQSDVFHHIRYSNSPRSVVPHKSIDIPKPLLTLEDYREVELKLEKKLKNEGYGTSHKTIKKVAKGVRALFFLFIFLPFYLVVQLPMTMISLLFSMAFRLLYTLVKPVLKALDRVIQILQKGAAKIDLTTRFAKISRLFTRSKKELSVETLKKKKSWKFWTNWSLPQLKIPSFKLKFPRFTLGEKFKNFSISLPKFSWNWKGVSKHSSKLFSFRWNLPSLSWNWIPKFSLPKFKKNSWKLPALKNPFSWMSTRKLRVFIAAKSLRWNIKPWLDALKAKLPKFQFAKKEKQKKSRDFKAAASMMSTRIEQFFDDFVSVFPPIPQMILRVIGGAIAFVIRSIFNTISRVMYKVWKGIRRVFIRLGKVQENLQKMSFFTQKAKTKTFALVDRGIEAVSRPIVRSIENTHSKLIPVRLKIRRWTFLAGIVVELSLVFLSEAIIEFQEWNESQWISRLQF